MLALSPQVGDLLLQATQSQDLEEAIHKVLREYFHLKLASLAAEIDLFEKKWGGHFPEFRDKTREEYRYEVKKDFWEWERLETLKAHYQTLQERWN